MGSSVSSTSAGKIKGHSGFGPSDPWAYAILSCLVLAALLSIRLLGDADLGYHLKGGQWIWQNHQFPVKDLYTYTSGSRDYIDLHWLYQVTLYLLYSIGQYKLITLCNAGLVVFVFFLLYKRLRLAGAPLWMCALLLGMGILGCETRFQARPEVLSWFLMSLMLIVLDLRAFHDRNFLFFLPVIQMIWANTEGLFGIGWGLMVFYLVSNLLQGPKLDRKLFQWSSLAVLSCLMNPYFWKGALLPFTYLATLGPHSLFKQGIFEFQSPWTLGEYLKFVPALSLFSYKFSCFFLLFLITVTFKKRKVHEFLIAGSFFYLSATALRNIPLFLLATLPLAAVCWNDLEWDWIKKGSGFLSSRKAVGWAFTLCVLCFSLRVITNAYYVSDRRMDRFGWGLDGENQPLKASEFLVRNNLEGRILNQINTGGWLDWQGPGKVFIDGRTDVIGEGLFKEYFDSMKPGGLGPLIDKYHFDIICLNALSANQWVFGLRGNPDWRLAYLDECVALFLRKGYAPQVPALDEARWLGERGLSLPANRGEVFTLLQKPKPSAWGSFGEGFYRPVLYPNGLLTMAILEDHYGNPQAGEPIFLECIRQSSGRFYDFYFDAGLMYFFWKHYPEAKICMLRTLEEDRDNSQARQVLTKTIEMGGN